MSCALKVNVDKVKNSDYLLDLQTSVGALYLFIVWWTLVAILAVVISPLNIVPPFIVLAGFITIAIIGIVRKTLAQKTLSILTYGAVPAFFFLIYINGLPPTGFTPIVSIMVLVALPRNHRLILALVVSLAPLIVLLIYPEQVSPVFYRIVVTSIGVTLLLGFFLNRFSKINRDVLLANQAKSDFLANMSHEIRTPLNSVFGSLQIIELNRSDEAMVDKHVKVALQSYQSVIGIVNDILDMTKIAEGKLSLHPEPNRLADLIALVCSEQANVARQKGIQLEYKISGAAKKHNRLLDTLRVTQVLRNLISNAVKFTKEGKVTISVRSGETPDQILIRVRDTGVGIPGDKLHTIFDAFEQAEASRITERGGTGLGLAITKCLVEMMSGEISVKSIVGVGTTFVVSMELPVTQYPVADKVIDEIDDVTPARILLAEDMKANSMVFEAMLSDEQYTIDTVEDGKQAVELALANHYDLIFMDIMMPKMNGIEALQAIRLAGCETPIVACTANVMKEDVARYMAAGFDAVMGKPFLRAELRQYIQSAVTTAIN